LYGNANPVGNVDPSGNATLVSQVFTQLGYLSTAYATVAFIQNLFIDTVSELALDIVIPDLGKEKISGKYIRKRSSRICKTRFIS
jgi:hypothetical protein